jgi:uncharacterized protein (DUF433 family)
VGWLHTAPVFGGYRTPDILDQGCVDPEVQDGPTPARFSLQDVALTDLIETRPGVRSGKPCFVGTRITVYDVLEYLASGMTTEEIVGDFPELTIEHVRSALEFAALRERRLASA